MEGNQATVKFFHHDRPLEGEFRQGSFLESTNDPPKTTELTQLTLMVLMM